MTNEQNSNRFEGESNPPPPVPDSYRRETPFPSQTPKSDYVPPSAYVQGSNNPYYYQETGERPPNPYTLPYEPPATYTRQTAPPQKPPAQAVGLQVAKPYPVFWTYVVLAAIVVMLTVQFVVELGSRGFSFTSSFNAYNLLNLGGLNQQLVRQGEWWRLISVMFLHANLLHILFNGFALYAFGRELERLIGGTRFLIIYFIGGLAGSILSFGLGTYPVAVGASGAIFALMGGMLGYLWRHRLVYGSLGRSYITNLLINLGINVVITLSVPNIDAMAHFGGLAGGALLGFLLPSDFTRRAQPVQNNNKLAVWFADWWVVVAVVAAEILLFAFFLSQPFTPKYRI